MSSPSSASTPTCMLCDEAQPSPAVECPLGHVTCAGCFTQQIVAEAGAHYEMPRRADGEVQCAGRKPNSTNRCGHLFCASNIAECGELAMEAYIQSKVRASVAADRRERRASEVGQNKNEDCKVFDRLRAEVRENILTLRCPRIGCGQAFVDFDGCNAPTCHACGCGFCAICFKDCGEDAHDHIRDTHGSQNLFWRHEKWIEHIEQRQKAQLQDLFEDIERTIHDEVGKDQNIRRQRAWTQRGNPRVKQACCCLAGIGFCASGVGVHVMCVSWPNLVQGGVFSKAYMTGNLRSTIGGGMLTAGGLTTTLSSLKELVMEILRSDR
eukprot:gnl/MRDRNA2_/MRDRNA2_128630_c0_seq1.p1 gnl/MRDRNA2_/MRDRNA2_128630_c0~~gnl/MRDRNA2_/MRDRNA2_128630_c0_seq1.p1  ORF type:complete len:365 (+),score=62.67 gnl/MRDRNA2_/MRDRNA2_128630_c0_seq1:125-1096(+)